MAQNYSQRKALLALVKASFKSMLKTPTAVLFTFLFPLIFIFAFSYLDPSVARKYNIALSVNATLNEDSKIKLTDNENYKWVDISNTDSLLIHQYFTSKKLDAIVNIKELDNDIKIDIENTTLDLPSSKALIAVIHENWHKQSISEEDHKKAYIPTLKKIDFILPGQLGFALLAASVFGTAFLFFNLRNQLVLKRFIATPVHPFSIILAECIARGIIQIGSACTLLLIGHFVWDYTLINGIWTFINIMILCIFALFTFLSYGFIIAAVAKSEAVIPPLANIVTLPQFIIAGTFFPVEQLPNWVQLISKVMPLTYFNDAIRNIAFNGSSLWDVKFDLAVLLFWGIVSYIIAIKTFKWE